MTKLTILAFSQFPIFYNMHFFAGPIIYGRCMTILLSAVALSTWEECMTILLSAVELPIGEDA